MSVLDTLLARVGKTRADLNRNSTLGQKVRGKAVSPSREIERIADLPIRDWANDPTLPELTQLMSEWLRLLGSTATLLPGQAQVLADLHDFRGSVGWRPVGAGKTLCSFLAVTVGQRVHGTKRALLLVPANLMREKTPKDLAAARRDWDIPDFRVMSYESLSVAKGEARLRAYDPDLIVADEAHMLKSIRSARTRKFARFMSDYPDVPFVPLTGTPMGGGLQGCAHLFRWALPPELRPLPEPWRELQDWSAALDFKVKDAKRLAPGALTRFCKDAEEAASLDGVRAAVGRRIVSTPGVVASSNQDCDASISIEAMLVDDYGPAVDAAFELCHEKWCTPDEQTFSEAAEGWAHQHEFALGFYSRWDPPAPKPWRDARREWHTQAREIILTNRSGIDSELMVANAVDAGKYDGEALAEWRALRKTFVPNPTPVWIDDTALEHAAEWLTAKGPKGVCWVHRVDFAVRLAQLTGIPYYGAGGLDAAGRSIEDHAGRGSLIASIESNKRGRNLQEQGFARNLLTYWPPTAVDTEQTMGRMHRRRQTADHVSYELLIGCRVQWENFTKAKARARIELQKTQMSQKILLGDDIIPHDHLAAQRGPRWAKMKSNPHKAETEQ